MAGAAEYRTEHIAETPRGWHVRMKAPGPQSQHLVAIAFPPGRRKKGSGRLVEILHPATERNPKCEVSEKAKKNPGELIIFGNPSLTSSDERELTKLWHTARIAGANTFGERVTWAAKEWDKTHPGQRMRAYKWLSTSMRGYGNPSTQAEKRAARERAARIRGARLNPPQLVGEHKGVAMYFEGISYNAPSMKLRGYSTDLALQRAIDRKLKKSGAKKNQGRLIDAIRHGDRVTIVNRFGQQRTGRAVMRSSTGGWVLNMGGAHGTPGLADDSNVVRVKRSKNPVRMTVFFDPGIKKYTAALYDPKFGNLYASGFTKKQAAQALRDRVREYRRSGTLPAGGGYGNPRHLTVPEKHQLRIARDTLRMPDAMAKVMGGPTKEQAREIILRLTGKKARENPLSPMARELRKYWRSYFQKVLTPAQAKIAYELHRKGSSPETAIYLAKQRANPRRRRKDRKRRNPDETRSAVRLFEKFHGRDPKEITEKHVSAAMRKDYTALGDLEHLEVITPLGQTVRFQFEGDGVKLASSPDGKQLYCIGGNQNLSSCLDHASLEKDFIDLGEAVQVQYLARKVHANFEPVSYYHKFGEKTGARPQLAYDKLKRQIFFVGGEYFIDTKQGVSPGIEN